MTTKHLLLMVGALALCASSHAITWTVMDQDGLHYVQPAYVDRLLLSIPDDKVAEASQHIAMRAVKMDNGEYALHAHVRGLGGGPIFGQICGWTTRIVGHTACAVVAWCVPPLAPEMIHISLELVEPAAQLATLAGTLAPTG